MNSHQTTRDNTWRIIAGLMILGLGVIHLLNNFDVIDAGPYATRWWPAVFIVIGIKFIFVRRGNTGLSAGAFWIGTGTLFLLSTLGYMKTPFPQLLWPIMLIWFGLITFLGLPRCRSHSNDGRES